MGDNTNYVKIHEAVQAFSEWSVPSIQACFERWHQNKQTLPSCQSSSCPSHKKPTIRSGACQSCIAWGIAVDAECHSPGRGVQWRNVNASLLHKDPVEVAKGFVFIMPHGQTCSSFDDFDIGGILKMMIGFNAYHRGNQTCGDKIQKVVDIRNSLSHMKVKDKMQVPDAQMNNYFHDIKDLVTDLESRHPCLKGDTIITLLNKIHRSEVTADMMQRAMRPLTDGLEQALVQALQQQTRDLQRSFGDLKLMIEEGKTEGAEALQQQTRDLQHVIEEHVQDLKHMVEGGYSFGAEALQQQTKDLESCIRQTVQEETEAALRRLQLKLIHDAKSPTLSLEMIRRELMEEYLETRGTLPLLPGMPEEFAKMDDIFVNLEIIKEDKRPSGVIGKKLKSYGDLVCIEKNNENSDDTEFVKRILVRGKAGVGKSTTISKLSYDWACNKQDSPMSKFELVFVITVNEIDTDTDLIGAIRDQLLPKVSRESLEELIQSHANSVAILFDGYDEATSHFDQCKDIRNVLCSKWLAGASVIVTTRPNLVGKFCQNYGSYLQVEIIGFSWKAREKYVKKFLRFRKKDDNALVKICPKYRRIMRKKLDFACKYVQILFLCCMFLANFFSNQMQVQSSD